MWQNPFVGVRGWRLMANISGTKQDIVISSNGKRKRHWKLQSLLSMLTHFVEFWSKNGKQIAWVTFRSLYVIDKDIYLSIYLLLLLLLLLWWWWWWLLPPPKEVMYLVRSVCLSVCLSDNWKNCERIWTKFVEGVVHGPETNEFNFGDDPDHYLDPGVRSGSRSGSGKNYHNSIMPALGGGLCSLSTSSCYYYHRNLDFLSHGEFNR